ncbi:hypothetical protein ONA91_09350 [Micromonospora sp. DR5-3]|uniref:hypothetical protein n=1 Tax=unclassified Micromonospora TaxID=2617518 RepID=UPI0011D82275|nr:MULTISPECIES: hypothetical protein [unclassified Micromonospora]MCW3814659.1 hypothetical protein [Micromonospora sp. DR5-3]TYC22482.1 hypothetical protein FXF52_20365 [Micromonospora sp. MP36]
MTSPAEPASGDATQASQLTKPLRELAALVLLGANAVLLFVGLLRLLVPTDDYSTFSGRAGSAFFAFIGVESAVLPVLAVLLATHVSPALPKAKLITQAALGEYAFAALFGALTFLVWLVGRLAEVEVLDALLGLLTRLAWVAIFGVGAFVVVKVWRTLYYVPRPKPQPGLYGQPQPGWPQQPAGYPAPGQPGGYPTAGQPGGYPAPGQPGGYPVPGGYAPASPANQPGGYPPPAQPGQPGQPQSVPPFNTAPPHAPQSAPPFGAPHPAPPFGQPPSADPTQAIPRQPADPGQPTTPDSDRTQRFDRDDPNHPR